MSQRKISQARQWSEPVLSIGNFLLDLLFPPRCAFCGRVDTAWCGHCQARLDALPIDNIRPKLTPPLSAIATTGYHEGFLQDLVHALKYDNAAVLAKPLGKRLARRVSHGQGSIDTIVAVPLHVQRLQERRYNQSRLLAQQVAELLGKPDSSESILRNRYTRPQVGLNREDRQHNVADAFQAEISIFQGQRVLLIDDVFTTGATLGACGQALIEAGAVAVYGLTVTAAA